jgi:hypothetical protein
MDDHQEWYEITNLWLGQAASLICCPVNEAGRLPILAICALFTREYMSNTKSKQHRATGHARRGGSRPNAGRKPWKDDRQEWGRLYCTIKLATINALREAAASTAVGELLQWHLDRHPIPTRQQYLDIVHGVQPAAQIKKRKTPVLVTQGGYGKILQPRQPRARGGGAKVNLASKSFAAKLRKALSNDGN